MRTKQSYTPEFRAEAVRLVTDYSRPVRHVANELGVNESTLRVWLQRAKTEGLEMAKKADSELEAENRDLKRQLREADKALTLAKSENQFLKKAASFFAAETSNQSNGTK